MGGFSVVFSQEIGVVHFQNFTGSDYNGTFGQADFQTGKKFLATQFFAQQGYIYVGCLPGVKFFMLHFLPRARCAGPVQRRCFEMNLGPVAGLRGRTAPAFGGLQQPNPGPEIGGPLVERQAWRLLCHFWKPQK